MLLLQLDDCDGPGNVKDKHMDLGSIWYMLPGPDFIKNQGQVLMVDLRTENPDLQ